MPDALRSLVHLPGPGGPPKGTLHSAGISVPNGYWQREGTVLHPKWSSLGMCGNCPASLSLSTFCTPAPCYMGTTYVQQSGRTLAPILSWAYLPKLYLLKGSPPAWAAN